MEVLHPTALLAEPNKCILCDETPHPSEVRVIDTGQNMIAPFSDNVWRKYVCEKCGTEIANRLGFVSNEQAKAAFHASVAATERLNHIRDVVAGIAADIKVFATDIDLGNERSNVGKTVEGEYLAEATASEKKAATSKPKAAERSPVATGQ